MAGLASKAAAALRARVKLFGQECGKGVRIGARVALRPPRQAKVRFGQRVRIAADCAFGFAGPGPTLVIGERTYLESRTRINVAEAVEIGADCAISWDVDILDTDFHAMLDGEGRPRPFSAPVRIGDRVWIGAGAKVLKGVTIGHDSVVAAGAVVTRSCPPFSIIAGVPARAIARGHGWRP